LAFIINWRDSKPSTPFQTQHLPRNYVRMVLKRSDQHFVAGIHVGSPVAVRNQIQGLGCSTYKNYLPLLFGIHELPHLLTSFFIVLSCPLAQEMTAAMYV